jgi:hypothetical protein
MRAWNAGSSSTPRRFVTPIPAGVPGQKDLTSEAGAVLGRGAQLNLGEVFYWMIGMADDQMQTASAPASELTATRRDRV